METRLPACSERADGSKPQYTVMGFSRACSIDGSVSASTRPRALSSSISFIQRYYTKFGADCVAACVAAIWQLHSGDVFYYNIRASEGGGFAAVGTL